MIPRKNFFNKIKIFFFFAAGIFFIATKAGANSGKIDIPFKPFFVYKDLGDEENHFYATGWMGQHDDIDMKDDCIRNAKTMDTCIKIVYTPNMRPGGAGWAGIYWQNPRNNWGSQDGAYDLTGSKYLTFWAKGEKGGEVISKFQVGGISGDFPDSDSGAIYKVKLSPEWKKYSIEIEDKDLTYISGGFCIIVTLRENPKGLTMFLDDICYE